jgi:hypothetical protein
MTRAELVTRIQNKCRRSDSTTTAEIKDWINEVMSHVEKQKPFFYTKKPQEAILAADTKSFTLPSNLILHHPFQLLLKDTAGINAPSFKYLIKTTDNAFDMHFPNPEISATKASYWVLRGKSDALGFDVYPVMDADETLRVSGGYFYTPAFSADADNNWLTNNHQWLLIEGAAALCFEHYGEATKADRARVLFRDLLQRAAMEQDDMDTSGRLTRVKMLSDMPLTIATKIKMYGY